MTNKYRPRVIHTPEQYREAVAFLESLTGEETEDVLEDAQLVAQVLANYEQKTLPSKTPSPGQLLRFLMESNDLTQVSLGGLVNISQSTLSEILSDKRTPTAAQAVRLSEQFSLEPTLFMDEESAQVISRIVDRQLERVADALTTRVADEVVRKLARA